MYAMLCFHYVLGRKGVVLPAFFDLCQICCSPYSVLAGATFAYRASRYRWSHTIACAVNKRWASPARCYMTVRGLCPLAYLLSFNTPSRLFGVDLRVTLSAHAHRLLSPCEGQTPTALHRGSTLWFVYSMVAVRGFRLCVAACRRVRSSSCALVACLLVHPWL